MSSQVINEEVRDVIDKPEDEDEVSSPAELSLGSALIVWVDAPVEAVEDEAFEGGTVLRLNAKRFFGAEDARKDSHLRSRSLRSY
jgi:hypothetical protein